MEGNNPDSNFFPLYSSSICWQDWQCLINHRWERLNLQGKLLIDLTQVLGTADDLKCRKQILILLEVINHWTRPEEKGTWSRKDGYEGPEFTLSVVRILPGREGLHSMVIHLRLFASHTSGVDWRDWTILEVGPWEHWPTLSLLAQTPLVQFCSDCKVVLRSEHLLQMFTQEVVQCKCGWWWERCLLKRIRTAGVPWAMRARQARGRGKERTFLGKEMSEGGEKRWCLCFLGLCQSSAAACKGEAKGYVGSLGFHRHPSHLPCGIGSSLGCSGLPFQLSGLSLLSPLPLPELLKQQLVLGSCSLSSGGKTQITFICQGALSQARDSCKTNPSLVATWEQKSC